MFVLIAAFGMLLMTGEGGGHPRGRIATGIFGSIGQYPISADAIGEWAGSAVPVMLGLVLPMQHRVRDRGRNCVADCKASSVSRRRRWNSSFPA